MSFFHWGEDALVKLKRPQQMLRRKNGALWGQTFEVVPRHFGSISSDEGPHPVKAKRKGRRDRPDIRGYARPWCPVPTQGTFRGEINKGKTPVGGEDLARPSEDLQGCNPLGFSGEPRQATV